MTTIAMPNKIHQGRNVKRIREILDIKQDALASLLGDDWNQQKVSLLEQKEIIDAPLLEQVAKALNVPADAIKNLNEDAANNYFNTFNDSSVNNGTVGCTNYHCTFNAIDKLVEVFEENKKLYERLLQTEKEKNELLEKRLAGRGKK
ncbi:helix-turn-helix domain-containing protein [Chitinophaga eiseniae]|uniref:Helix-turn-helix transcriptional regulator n=1 Tax=Chitinophaga eiseniae TaxID=634771 RepID=A0A847SLQ9_9BACT|nr:helix-turn-helix transcriptional regulator [Chitinophaga eiseniae]NLR82901.1 helix-turn-helix transcriptional regulator [Chitinophaga eiseniae]